MQQRRWTVRSLTAAAAVAAAVAVPAHAVAEPDPPGLPPDALRAAAAAESPEALRAVESLLDAARTPALFEPPPRNTPQPFMQPAPTFGLGCGGGFTPYAMTTGWAQPGPNAVPPVQIGQLKIFVSPTIPTLPARADLKFVWLNMENFRGGVDTLDDTVGGVPQLSKTLDTGTGPVLSALFGSVQYVDGTFCQVVYTMGAFFA
ncbi:MULTISPECIES: hypothetical protein [Rhodococcus]|uniref:Secreted protein n=1 Tax=Rhodococcus rhodochrous KG-21 TaxID=1441923 RepID=A0A0M9WLM4_RHORH|nr:hypothetical protein [Rhodococcus rhodochrous]KOS53517.1 hypothetical protein Z051_25060 [Rhodococcus rhodochrous KG-21]